MLPVARDSYVVPCSNLAILGAHHMRGFLSLRSAVELVLEDVFRIAEADKQAALQQQLAALVGPLYAVVGWGAVNVCRAFVHWDHRDSHARLCSKRRTTRSEQPCKLHLTSN